MILILFILFCIDCHYFTFGGPIRDTLGPKTNYTVNLNNFSTTRPFLDLKVLMDRACQRI